MLRKGPDPARSSVPLRYRVWMRLMCVTSLLLLLAVGVTVAFVVRLATTEISRSVSERNQQLVAHAAEQIDSFIDNSGKSLSELTNLFILNDNEPRDWDTLLEQYVLTAQDFGRIAVVDASGRISSDSVAGPLDAADFDLESVTQARAAKAHISSVLSSPSGPILTFVLPMRKAGAHAASLIAELRLARVQSVLDGIVVGTKGSASVVTGDGTLVARTGEAPTEPGAGLHVQKAVASLGWLVVMDQPAAEAFLPVSLLLRRSLALVGFVLLVVTYLAFFFVRMISRPLDLLIHGTMLVARGDSDHRIPVASHDELGVLARSFNSMMDRLRERAFALEESERNYRIITESVNDIIFSLDLQGKIVYLNGRAESILGYHLSEMLGRPFSDFVSDEDREQGRGFLDWLSDRGKYALPVEVVMVAKSGVELTMECEAVPLHKLDGEGRIYGVARDVTERNQLEEKVQRAEKLSALGEIVSGVTHELRNAVAGISASAELLRSRKGEGSAEDLDRVLREALRAERIVNGLLDFSPDETPPMEPLGLNTVLEDALELRRRDIEEHGIELVRVLDPRLPRVMANPGRLRQVFLNLITNAIQALSSSAMGPKALVASTHSWRGDAIAAIWDTGPGIPKKVLSRVFDPFYTTKKGGTGLGLSISLGIVQSLGGELHVHSLDGKGACFSVQLPAVQGDEKAAQSAAKTTAPPDAETEADPHLKGKGILVVEDEDSIREFVCSFLRSYGCSVDGAADVREAVALLSSRPAYNLVISDFRMPEIDGQGLYEWICSNKPALRTRLIFITGDGLNPVTRMFLRRSGIPYLFKPVSSLALIEAIRSLLQRP